MSAHSVRRIASEEAKGIIYDFSSFNGKNSLRNTRYWFIDAGRSSASNVRAKDDRSRSGFVDASSSLKITFDASMLIAPQRPLQCQHQSKATTEGCTSSPSQCPL